jgi:hypothetical protein
MVDFEEVAVDVVVAVDFEKDLAVVVLVAKKNK